MKLGKTTVMIMIVRMMIMIIGMIGMTVIVS